jgi:hypothetical protein
MRAFRFRSALSDHRRSWGCLEVRFLHGSDETIATSFGNTHERCWITLEICQRDSYSSELDTRNRIVE